MNREIKFRAWDKEDNVMLTWNKWREEILDGIPLDCGDEWTERVEIMQYTGLKDKNGKEIYEGDIILKKFWNRPYSKYARSEIVKCKVVWYKNKFTFDKIEKGRDYWCHFNDWWDTCEIIGNIYKDKELLNEARP